MIARESRARHIETSGIDRTASEAAHTFGTALFGLADR